MITEGQIKLSKDLPAIAEGLTEVLENLTGERISFSLVLWGPDAKGTAQYISNVERQSAIEGLKLLLKQWQVLEAEEITDTPLHEKKGDL